MARQDPDRNVQQCLLDRLIDLEPHTRTDPPLTRPQSLERLKKSVKRDLEWLLNTHRTGDEVPEAYREVKKSLYTYGLLDVASVTLDSVHDEQRLLRSLENSITLFEPRLTRVRVTSYERMSKKKPAIQFHVEAMLMIDPAPERISFDTVLEIAKGAYQVKDAQGA